MSISCFLHGEFSISLLQNLTLNVWGFLIRKRQYFSNVLRACIDKWELGVKIHIFAFFVVLLSRNLIPFIKQKAKVLLKLIAVNKSNN